MCSVSGAGRVKPSTGPLTSRPIHRRSMAAHSEGRDEEPPIPQAPRLLRRKTPRREITRERDIAVGTGPGDAKAPVRLFLDVRRGHAGGGADERCEVRGRIVHSEGSGCRCAVGVSAVGGVQGSKGSSLGMQGDAGGRDLCLALRRGRGVG